MDEKILVDIIQKKLNYNKIECEPNDPMAINNYEGTPQTYKIEYDGFDMSGFHSAHYKNMEILSRFENYMSDPFKEERGTAFIFPIFHKGIGKLVRVAVDGEGDVIDDSLSGATTMEIIIDIIVRRNPNIISISYNKHRALKKDIERIVNENTELIHEVSQLNKTISLMENDNDYRKRKSKEHKRWTKEEEGSLVKMYNNKKNILNISKILQRTSSSILSRLNKLELIRGTLVTDLKNRICDTCLQEIKYKELAWKVDSKNICYACFYKQNERKSI